jgi:hypothetical protein
MDTRRQTRVNTITLTLTALLGLGALTGCSGNGSAPSTVTASSGKAASSAGSSPGASPLAASVAKSAPALLRGALAALRSGGSVHVDDTTTLPGGSIVQSDDSTASGGRQVMSIGQAAHATILFIAGVGYVDADAGGLNGFFGVPQPQAEQFAGRWIAVRRGDKLGQTTYDDLTAGITLSSVASELEAASTPKLAPPSTINGQRVVAVQAPVQVSGQTSKTTETLDITDNSLLRPVQAKMVAGASYSSQISFSHWGETLHLSAPSSTIPASSVRSAPVVA